MQRAHQNTLENYAPVVAMAIVNGLTFPITTAASLVAWSVGRMLYIRGYSSGHPEKRSLGGAISHLADLPLFVMCFVSAHKMCAARSTARASRVIRAVIKRTKSINTSNASSTCARHARGNRLLVFVVAHRNERRARVP